MNNNNELSLALNILERKIATLNMKLLESDSNEIRLDLEKYLLLKKDLYSGNISLIKKIIDNEN